MHKIALWISDLFLGREWSQGFFEFLLKVSLRGMNIGSGAHHDKSGEKHAAVLVHQSLKGKEAVIFDAGANHGNYALMLSSVFSENAKIFSFEPSRATFNILSKDNRRKIKH